jgi:regulatory protein YycI of two-component signal transduction system YycFG
MEQDNTYKYLSIVLAIIAIIFAVLYFTKETQPASESLGDASAQVEMCRDNIAKWRMENSNQSTTTLSARSELMAILEDCEGVLTGAETMQ